MISKELRPNLGISHFFVDENRFLLYNSIRIEKRLKGE